MIRSCDEEEEFDNSLDFIIRGQQYKKEIYYIKEEIKQNENLYKLYGNNRERNLNVVITKVTNISENEKQIFIQRLLTTIKLIEENKLLIENLWVEKIDTNNYNLYVSELTNTIYRNEYNLITLNNYMSSTKNTYKDNIQILILILQKILYFQKYNFSHLNLHPNNIYINIKNNSIIYFGPPKLSQNFSNDCSYLWYSSPEELYINEKIYENNIYGINNDIWSLGCIICELFFVNFPLFQVYTTNEKILKIIDILGFPQYNDVNYMNKYQYDSLYKRIKNNNKENNLFELLLSKKEKKSNLYYFKAELIDIIKGCLAYNIKERLNLEDILQRLEYLNNNISSEFHSKILETINLTEESETNNNSNNNKSNSNKNKIINNKSLESEEFKEKINNNNNENIINESNNSLKNINANNIRYEFNNNSLIDDIKDREKKKIKNKGNNIKFLEESEKKENIMDYFVQVKKEKITKEKDEYKELNESKYIIFNNILNFYRN